MKNGAVIDHMAVFKGRCAPGALSGMRLAASGDLDAVLEQGKDRGQAFFSAALAAGKVDDERAASESGHGAREPGEGMIHGAEGSHGLGKAWGFAVNHAAGCFGSAVARTEAGASNGEDQSRSLKAEFFECCGDPVFVVWHEARPDFGLRPLLAEECHEDRARGVGHQALRTTVGDGEDGKEHKRDCNSLFVHGFGLAGLSATTGAGVADFNWLRSARTACP